MPFRFADQPKQSALPRITLRAGLLRVGCATLFMFGGAGIVKDATATNETRTLSFHHTHSGEDLTVTFKKNGRYDEAALKKLNWLLRDWRTQEPTTMNRQLFDIVWEVYRDVDGDKPINIISSYRSPRTNAMLHRRSRGVARHSQHMLGNAMDFFIPGVSLDKIRAAGLRLQRGGVGFYPTSGSPFVHLDTASIRHWPRMTSDQLARVFPDGRTVHLPSDGGPLKGYALAAAEIERRKSGESTARGSKTFLAGLFGRKANTSDDDESGADETPAASAKPADKSADKIRVASAEKNEKPDSVKTDSAVPLPRSRPVNTQTFQVAAATSREVSAPKVGFASPTDIINARGFWDNGASSAKPENHTLPAAVAAAEPTTTASLAPSGNDDAALDERTLARAKLAMAYAANERIPALKAGNALQGPALQGNVRMETPAAATPVARAANVSSRAKTDPKALGKTAIQPIPAKASQMQAAWRATASMHNDPWLRAMIVSPNSQNYLSATQAGDADMLSLASLLHQPRTALMIAFAPQANPDLTISQFSGPAVTFLSTVTFTTQATAALR